MASTAIQQVLHHRKLVSLLGFCDEEGEQMLVYEFMSNGTLRDHLSEKYKESLSFAMRIRIALGSAKGVLYLHTKLILQYFIEISRPQISYWTHNSLQKLLILDFQDLLPLLTWKLSPAMCPQSLRELRDTLTRSIS